MPITTGAKKALRGSKKKRVFNMRRKNTMGDILKKVKKLVVGGSTSEAQALLPSAYKAIDKAAKTGIIKKNTAARKKSRISSLLKSK